MSRRKKERGETRQAVADLLEQGLSHADVAQALGVSKPTVSYHARRLGRVPDERFSRRYDWQEIQRYHDAGHSARECIARFGFSAQTWHAACLRGALAARPVAAPLSRYLVRGRRVSRGHLKRRLIAEGLKVNRCERCGIGAWRGAPLAFALHHRNGDGDDNRLENLQLLCPNCHAQTPNFAGRNVGRVARLPESATRTRNLASGRPLPLRGTVY